MASRCYFSPSKVSIIDLIDSDGLTSVMRQTAAQVRERYPDAVEKDFDEAYGLFLAASITPPERITEERFLDMLNVLPPVRWVATPSFEHFELSEHINGPIVAYFVRAASDYWQFQDKAGMSTAQIVERITAAEQAEQSKGGPKS